MTRSSSPMLEGRRGFLLSAGSALGCTLAACGASTTTGAKAQSVEGGGKHEEAEVTPGEDLMQEHGLLERILLVYDEGARRIEAGEPLDLTIITRGADIIRRFVEEYHEKLEEEFVFPRLQQEQAHPKLPCALLEHEQTADHQRQADRQRTRHSCPRGAHEEPSGPIVKEKVFEHPVEWSETQQ